MSEENQNYEQEVKNTSKCNSILTLVTVSLVLSALAFCMSAYTIYESTSAKISAPLSATGSNTISKKYDRGRSLTKALETKKPMLVFFYTDWCGYCQRFAPVFDKVTKDSKIKKNVAIAFVNCEDEANREFVQEYEIQGFPSVFVVDKEGNRTQLDNGTFFNDDTKEVLVKRVLELIGVEKAAAEEPAKEAE